MEIMLEVLLITGILIFILWLYRPKFEVQVSSKTIDEFMVSENLNESQSHLPSVNLRDRLERANKVNSPYTSASWRSGKTVVSFIPIEKASYLTTSLGDKLKQQEYRTLTLREINCLSKQYTKKKEFDNFTILFLQPPTGKIIAGDIICLQWQNSEVIQSNVKHRDILYGLALKQALGESLRNKFFIAVTKRKKNLWSKFLDHLYYIKQVFLHRLTALLTGLSAKAKVLLKTLTQTGCFASMCRIAKQLMNGQIKIDATKKSA